MKRRELMESALEREFPIPDNPHASVKQKNSEQRDAFAKGYTCAIVDDDVNNIRRLQFSAVPGEWFDCTAAMYDAAPKYGYKRRIIKVVDED